MKRLIFSYLLSAAVFSSQPLFAMEDYTTTYSSTQKLKSFKARSDKSILFFKNQKENLKESEELDISGFDFFCFSDSLDLKNLHTMRLNRNANVIYLLPLNLPNLRTLDLSESKLTAFPNQLTNLTNLEELVLSNNQLTSLPPKLCDLEKLKVLDVSFNELTTLPLNIYKPRKVMCVENRLLKGNEATWTKNLHNKSLPFKVKEGNGIRTDYAPPPEHSYFFKPSAAPRITRQEYEESYARCYSRAFLFSDLYHKLDKINQKIPLLRFLTTEVFSNDLPKEVISIILHKQSLLLHPMFIDYYLGRQSPEFTDDWQSLTKKYLDDFFAS